MDPNDHRELQELFSLPVINAGQRQRLQFLLLKPGAFLSGPDVIPASMKPSGTSDNENFPEKIRTPSTLTERQHVIHQHTIHQQNMDRADTGCSQDPFSDPTFVFHPAKAHFQSFTFEYPTSFKSSFDLALRQSSLERETDKENDSQTAAQREPNKTNEKDKSCLSTYFPTRKGSASRLATKRAQCAAIYGESRVKADGEPKGQVRGNPYTGALEWWHSATERFIPAAYHQTFREEFILLDRQQHQPYKKPPAQSFDPLDVTSNCEYLNQHLWDFETASGRKNIQDFDGNRVMTLHERPNRSEWLGDFKPWSHRGFIILDLDNNPIADIPGIPRCLSSQLEGGRMEALQRVFPWLQRADLRARMPAKVNGKPLSNPSTFGQRQSRYRDRYKMIAWNVRKGTENKKAALFAFPQGIKRSHHGSFTPRAVNENMYQGEDDGEHLNLLRSKRLRWTTPKTIQHPCQVQKHTSSNHDNSQGSVSQSRSSSFPDDHITDDDYLPDIGESTSNSGITDYAVNETASWGSSSTRGTTAPDSSNKFCTEQQAVPAVNDDGPINDHRGVRPKTLQQQMVIGAALFYTKADYRSLHRREPPTTDSTSSYMNQVSELDSHNLANWTGGGKAPELVTVGPFFSFDNVPIPDLPNEVMTRLSAAQELVMPVQCGLSSSENAYKDRSADVTCPDDLTHDYSFIAEQEATIRDMTHERRQELVNSFDQDSTFQSSEVSDT